MAEILPGPWAEFSDVWDTLSLGGREWPGIASVVISRANKWDEKKAKGKNNAERTYTGTDPAKVRIVVRFWNAEEHYDELVSECLPIVEPQDEKKRKDPLEISHAVTQARRVNKITVDSVSGPNDNGDQTWSIEIEATEYRAPTEIKPGPKAGGSGSSCAELQRALTWFAQQIQVASARAGQLAVQVAQTREDFWANPGAYQAAVALQDANRIQLQAYQASLSKIASDMEKKGCPRPPSAFNGPNP